LDDKENEKNDSTTGLKPVVQLPKILRYSMIKGIVCLRIEETKLLKGGVDKK